MNSDQRMSVVSGLTPQTLAVGTKQNNSLYPLLKAQGFETHLAGDCWRIGRIAGAIGDGLRLGCIL